MNHLRVSEQFKKDSSQVNMHEKAAYLLELLMNELEFEQLAPPVWLPPCGEWNVMPRCWIVKLSNNHIVGVYGCTRTWLHLFNHSITCKCPIWLLLFIITYLPYTTFHLFFLPHQVSLSLPLLPLSVSLSLPPSLSLLLSPFCNPDIQYL